MGKGIVRNIPYGTIAVAIVLGVGIYNIPERPQWAMPIYLFLALCGIVGGLLHNLQREVTTNGS